MIFQKRRRHFLFGYGRKFAVNGARRCGKCVFHTLFARNGNIRFQQESCLRCERFIRAFAFFQLKQQIIDVYFEQRDLIFQRKKRRAVAFELAFYIFDPRADRGAELCARFIRAVRTYGKARIGKQFFPFFFETDMKTYAEDDNVLVR